MDDNRPIEDRVLEFLSTLHDNHEVGDQRWIRTLLDHGVNNTTSEIVELGAMIQTTVMDMLLGKLLGINPMILAKASLVEDYIGEIWENNNLEKQSLYNFILDNPEQREAILQLIQSKTDLESNTSLLIEQSINEVNGMVTQSKGTAQQQSNQHNQQPSLIAPIMSTDTANQDEPNIQEITMEEVEPEQTQTNIPNPITHDIKEIPDYRIRNRTEQPTNPFFITKKGSQMAGVLMANVPGENIEERTSYLTHMFKLAKEDRHLIGTTFMNGNHWFTVHFKLDLDMTNCIEKLNGKEGEDFKIICLKGSLKKETEEPTHTIKYNTANATSQQERKATTKENNLLNTKQIASNSQAKTLAKQIPTVIKGEDIRLTKKEEKANTYNLTKNKTNKGIGMMVGTFPGSNRMEQLAIIAEIFRIPVENTLVNIEHFNGNSWFTGYFQNEKERSHCISKVTEINREVINIDPSAENQTFKVHKLEDISPRMQKGKQPFNYKGKENTTTPTSELQNNNNRAKQSKLNTGTRETTIQILDIPVDFSTNRIKGAVKSYGKISHIRTNTNKRRNSKTATITFEEIKIDLERTWAIPMGENMARIAIYTNWEETIQKRNCYTARLYGISANASATRIMSAVRHTNAKTVHIPLNSKTGKKRRFAIIGFANDADLTKAIKKYISLFGNKTWWSTKDNREKMDRHPRADTSSTEEESSTESVQEESMEEEWSSTEDSAPPPKQQSQRKKENRKGKNNEDSSYQLSSNSILQQLTQQLRLLNTRMVRLESNNKFKKEIRGRPNFS
jgi:hypothetical protein